MKHLRTTKLRLLTVMAVALTACAPTASYQAPRTCQLTNGQIVLDSQVVYAGPETGHLGPPELLACKDGLFTTAQHCGSKTPGDCLGDYENSVRVSNAATIGALAPLMVRPPQPLFQPPTHTYCTGLGGANGSFDCTSY
jgi:hypothetical protein